MTEVLTEHFHPYSIDHILILTLTFSVAALLVLFSRVLRRIQDDRSIRYTSALVLFGNYIITWLYLWIGGTVHIPFQLCEVAVLLMVCALFVNQPFVRTLAFLWGLSGSLQVLLTPDLQHSFPHFRYFVFWISHCGLFLCSIYLLVRGLPRIRPKTILWAWLWTNGYALSATAVNSIIGTNFGYLAHKPAQPSILDYFGPWPWYILGCEGIALVSFLICSGFQRIVEGLSGPVDP